MTKFHATINPYTDINISSTNNTNEYYVGDFIATSDKLRGSFHSTYVTDYTTNLTWDIKTEAGRAVLKESKRVNPILAEKVNRHE